MGNTKEEILLVSLHLFAQDGYEAVSVSQIAGELGITKGALYRHYQSKRDIFDHILACMEQGDGEQAESHDMPQERKEDAPETSEDFINCFEQLHELLEEAEDNETKDSSESSGEFVPLKDTLQGNRRNAKKKEAEPLANRIKVFSFDSLNTLITLTSQIDCDYRGKNSLWKDPATKRYFLLLHRGKGKNAFRLMCSALAEYAKEENVTYATQAYYNEHFRLILKDNALTKLADI